MGAGALIATQNTVRPASVRNHALNSTTASPVPSVNDAAGAACGQLKPCTSAPLARGFDAIQTVSSCLAVAVICFTQDTQPDGERALVLEIHGPRLAGAGIAAAATTAAALCHLLRRRSAGGKSKAVCDTVAASDVCVAAGTRSQGGRRANKCVAVVNGRRVAGTTTILRVRFGRRRAAFMTILQRARLGACH